MPSSSQRFSVTDLDVEIDSDNRWVKLDIKSNVRVTVAQDVVDQVARELHLDPLVLRRAFMTATFQGREEFVFYCDDEEDFKFGVSIKNEENDEYSTPYKYVNLVKGTEDDE
tara:strand:- start:533 stop:868 length:336 start_codon:yes stop_codon:yes gene_type:complete